VNLNSKTGEEEGQEGEEDEDVEAETETEGGKREVCRKRRFEDTTKISRGGLLVGLEESKTKKPICCPL
jgi:hypothetical protein